MQPVVPNMEVPSLFLFSCKWDSTNKDLTDAVNNPLILLDKYNIIEEKCNKLEKGITDGTACVVSDGSFNPKSPIGPAGTSAVILAPSETSERSQYVTGANWITGTKEDQSAYRSELGGIIAGLKILDAVVRYKNITTGAVEIALDTDSAIDESRSNSPISIN